MFSQSLRPSEEDGKIRIRFENLARRLTSVNVDIVHKRPDNYHLQTHIDKPDHGDTSCFLSDELERIKTLDNSDTFKRYD